MTIVLGIILAVGMIAAVASAIDRAREDNEK